ncbi:MAG: cupredoxin domain-containing protein [Polyangiaceae bacterium]|nr:cupredoxin domain-containing protein [Polyangiaceae bacterium]
MKRTLAIVPVVALLSVGACNESAADERDDHSSHQAAAHQVADHQLGEHPAPATGADVAKRIVAVAVGDEGFLPSRIELNKGQDATLRFTRTSDSTCATKVVFPELKVEKELPLNEAVDVNVPTGESRHLAFHCGMGMYKSAVVVN